MLFGLEGPMSDHYSDARAQTSDQSKEWPQAVADYLKKSPWAVVGAFVVGMLTGGVSVVESVRTLGVNFGIVKSEKQIEAQNAFARDLFVLVGTRLYRMRRVLVARGLELGKSDLISEAERKEIWTQYVEILREWNSKDLNNRLLLNLYFGEKSLEEFERDVKRPIEALHRCIIQVLGQKTTEDSPPCPNMPTNQKDIDFAFDWLHKVDQSALKFAQSIRPKW
jgi:hypothetical protein